MNFFLALDLYIRHRPVLPDDRHRPARLKGADQADYLTAILAARARVAGLRSLRRVSYLGRYVVSDGRQT